MGAQTMIRPIFYALSAAACIAMPLAASAQTETRSPDFAADDALIQGARRLADATAGQAAGAPKYLLLGRDPSGEIRVKGLGMGQPTARAVTSADGVILVIWLRPADKAPTTEDRALAESLGRSLIVYDEPSRGKTMWEIARRAGTMQYRQVDDRPAAWQSWK